MLSRLDAGTLILQKNEVDVFTLLVLAADNLHELFINYDVSADIPEKGEMCVIVDYGLDYGSCHESDEKLYGT